MFEKWAENTKLETVHLNLKPGAKKKLFEEINYKDLEEALPFVDFVNVTDIQVIDIPSEKNLKDDITFYIFNISEILAKIKENQELSLRIFNN